MMFSKGFSLHKNPSLVTNNLCFQSFRYLGIKTILPKSNVKISISTNFSCFPLFKFRSFSDEIDHKKLFDSLAEKFQIPSSKPETWFKFNPTEVIQQAGPNVLKPFGDSLFTALMNVYPDNASIWKDRKYHRMYLDQVSKRLNLSKPEDWYDVKLVDIQDKADFGLFTQFYGGSITKALEESYPEVVWVLEKFDSSVRAIDESKPRKKTAAKTEKKETETKEKMTLPVSPSGVNYMLRRGKNRGVPTCRGCRRAFEDKTELRIQTTLLYEAPGLEPRPVQVNFCINQFCIQQALKNYRKKESMIHPFEGKVEVPPEIPKNEIPEVDGITWIHAS